MSIAAHHAEWLSLADTAGPFLSVAVLSEALPNGLDSHDPHLAAELRAAHDTWMDPEAAGFERHAVRDLHRAFVRFVLHRVLGFDHSSVRSYDETLGRYSAASSTHEDAKLVPDWVVVDGDQPLMLVTVLAPSQEPDRPLSGDGWIATPQERMTEHLTAVGCSLGLVTNGERWRLVSMRPDRAPGFATWLVSMWREERITLQSFRTLLGAHRFFSVPDEDTLIGLLDRSAQDQSEITTKLGNQTLEAVEILIRTIDRLDGDRGGALLADVPETELYDAAVTVMMRLIFLFFAEENDLLPMEEPLYVEQYAASSLRARLQEEADRSGEEVLETTADAWPRLLATWRAVFAGVEHGDMRLAPYGGSLFDPDRYPFLEGRLPGTSWISSPADPLPIDNRTVLHLLNALQTIREQGQRRRLSFSGLDVEQIGHVYEGMLDHTATRAEGWVLGLSGTGGKEPEIRLEQLESLAADDRIGFLKDRTGRNPATIRSWLAASTDEVVTQQFGNSWHPAFGGDSDAARRSKGFSKFIRADSTGAPTVFRPGSVYVCDSSHRGATGTHYTPRSLTIEIVADTLDPLVYHGPAEGAPREDWQLRTADEILDLKVCDPACGSGAFLVQACRYLSEKLVEARLSAGGPETDTKELLVQARREVAGRCLYGVDSNAMAVEMAKLSLWLITLSRDKPFSFIDHAIRVGDSLIGVVDLEWLRTWSFGDASEAREIKEEIGTAELDDAKQLRARLEALPALDSSDIAVKAELLRQAEQKTERLRVLADLLIAPSFGGESEAHVRELRDEAWIAASRFGEDSPTVPNQFRSTLGGVRPLHWALEFPEVFDLGGFDAVVGNPPFMGGQRLTGELGQPYREYLVRHLAAGTRGSADLAAYFFLRAYQLLRPEGVFGLLAVNTISEGDTRHVGLEQLLRSGASIYSAYPNEPWPNAAAVVTSRVHVYKGMWRGSRSIARRAVPRISAFLTSREDWSPGKLSVNANMSFQGSILLGAGFTLEPVAAAQLIAADAKNANVLLPYLNGQDLNQEHDQQPTRWVICFWDWSEEQARTFAAPFSLIEKLVKPARMAQNDRGAKRYWWRFLRPRPELYHAIGRGQVFEKHPNGWNPNQPKLDRIIATARVTKYWAPSLIPNDYVASDACVLFASDSAAFLALLLSCVHAEWAWKQSSTLETRLRYTPSDCFETFPLPVSGKVPEDRELEALGESFHQLRAAIMKRENVGLTDLYNHFHDPDADVEELAELRELQRRIDLAVLELYGWSDIDLDHGFRAVDYLPENDRHRFTISERARFEILDRLAALNRERFEEEQNEGPPKSRAKANSTKAPTARSRTPGRQKGTRTARSSADDTMSMFDMDLTEDVDA